MASDEQISAYLAGQLDPETFAQLEEELLDDPTSRAELVGQRRVSAGLHALLGDSAALERAIVTTLRSKSDELVVSKIVDATVERVREQETREFAWKQAWLHGFSTLGKAAAVIAIGAMSAGILHYKRSSNAVASVRDVSDARWSSSASTLAGTPLQRGWISLTSGVAELEMKSGATVVVQSPARFNLINENELRLEVGKLVAHVPPEAAGFTVHTDAGAVVDLGTRFGVSAKPVEGSAVHVFEGRVDVQAVEGMQRHLSVGEAVEMQLGGAQAITPIQFDPEAFPQGSITLSNLLVGGGFEGDSLVAIDSAPRQYGLWSGDPALVVPESDGVQPRSGQQMLRFELPETGKARSCEQWQLVDLKALRGMITGSHAQAVFSVYFNRTAGEPNCGITIAAFKGEPEQAPHFWAARQDKALAIAEAHLRTDSDPVSWERAQAKLDIPAEADFLLVQIAAGYPVTSDSRSGYNGHYADDAQLEIRVAPRPASTESVAAR